MNLATSYEQKVGNPYNTYQYAVLHRLIAQVSNMEVGEICFNIDIPHIYCRHIEGMKEVIKNEPKELPTLWINPEITSFYDFTIDDVKVENYKHSGSYKFEIAI